MNVLVADAFPSWGIDQLAEIGCTVTYEPTLAGDALHAAIGRSNCEILVVRGTKVTAAMLEAADSLALVVRAGAGFNTIDVEVASARSILVANCPGKNAVAVAELTFALILALDRRIADNVADLRKGVWNKKEYAKARGLKGRTLGIIGLGQVGRAVVRRALGFEMQTIAWSRSLTSQEADAMHIGYAQGPADVASRCDILSIHLPASPETKGLINSEVLGRLAPGSYVINTARAEVLDHKALLAAIGERHLRVGLDVFPSEPSSSSGPFEDAVVGSGGVVYGTHHIGASTDQAQDAVTAEAIRVVRTYRDTGHVPNCVNLRSSAGTTCCLRVRHVNRPGVLAYVLHEVSHAGINVEEMENVICQGGKSACARIVLEKRLPVDLLNRLRTGNEHILGVTEAMLSEHG